ncbi:MAG TPA: glycine betaine ABC transporter substrate-binding protein, partial [Rhodanobacteraceae bacterium]|nr:glycine betaine ABC transporter substrate-binding protein [Rhodanobacteraceae bacterium]
MLPLACLAQTAAAPAAAPTVVIGSKNFTESVVLGEIARLAARERGVDVQHRRSLGGTRILWRALIGGDIDAYPEYTGTITHELLRDLPPDAGVEVLRRRLAKLGIGITDPLGFNNTYAIGMLESEAGKLQVRDISDLVRHPDLRLVFSNEFMSRADGWPGLKAAYHLPQTARGMDHDLAYRALASGAADAIDLYSTDANIAYYHVRVLDDDRHYFPNYDAVFLYRLDLKKRAPAFAAALNGLAGTIDAKQMRAMNKAVKIDGNRETEVAAKFLDVPMENAGGDDFWDRIARYTWQHLELVGISLFLAIVLAVPLGIFAARYRRLGQVVLGMTGILQTVPSLALFVFMIPIFGIGAEPAIAALFLYSLLPIVRNTHAGLTGIPPSLLESAAALGLPPRVRLWRIELPLALRPILAGV